MQRIDEVCVKQENLAVELQNQGNNGAMVGGIQANRVNGYGRLTKLEFPRFNGDDVKGWLHFIKRNGLEVPCERYEKEGLKSFRAVVEDPMADLKNLMQNGTIKVYQDPFDALLSKVDITESQAISRDGMKTNIAMMVRMFKPRTLANTCCLANLQEATNKSRIKTKPLYLRYKNVASTSSGSYSKSNVSTSNTRPLLALLAPPHNTAIRPLRHRKNTSIGVRDVGFGRGKQANEGSQGHLRRMSVAKDSGSTVNKYLTKIRNDNRPRIENEDPREHISNITEIIDIFHSPGVSKDQEGNIKAKNEELQVVLNQICNFENNMNIITKEVQMEQHSIKQMLKYAKFMKDLLSKKGKAEESSKITLNERCYAILLNKISLKEKDPGIFTIPCAIGKFSINKALADLGANISLMPYFIFSRLDLGKLKPTHMCIQLANKSTQYPRGIAENVIVKIDKFIFLVDFVVLDMEEDHKIPIILGRLFLATSHAMIDVFNKKISFEVGNETITFDIEKLMKFSIPKDDTYLSIDMVDVAVLDHVQEIIPSDPLDSFLFEHILNYQERKFVNLSGDESDEMEHNLDGSNTANPQAEGTSIPSGVCFLDDNHELLVIISYLLSHQEKESLLQVLSKHKAALAWKVVDTKGINPSFCTHEILVEDNFKPVVQPQ
ncbi:transposon ty3-I gag-pol polyprotein [Tanacetum coccineum]